MGSCIHGFKNYSQWENCISLDFNFRGLNELQNPRKLQQYIIVKNDHFYTILTVRIKQI
jgi:hypothetical protein